MPTKSKRTKASPTVSSAAWTDVPATLSDNLFFGLNLDAEQKAFRDAIWNREKLIVFCDARAGSGKTTIATGTAELLVKYGRYKGIVYIVAPIQENKQGYLPGTLEEKSAPYFEGFYQALVTVGVSMGSSLNSNILNQKSGSGYIETLTHTFLRGVNFENQVVIIDEAQNFTVPELQKVLTRIHDSCKVVCIGHVGQIDIRNRDESGFERYLEHFKGADRVAVCKLVNNHRGWISNHADKINESNGGVTA